MVVQSAHLTEHPQPRNSPLCEPALQKHTLLVTMYMRLLTHDLTHPATAQAFPIGVILLRTCIVLTSNVGRELAGVSRMLRHRSGTTGRGCPGPHMTPAPCPPAHAPHHAGQKIVSFSRSRTAGL